MDGRATAPATVLLFPTSTNTISNMAHEMSGFSSVVEWISGESVSLPVDPQFTFTVGTYNNVKLGSDAEFQTMLVLASISTPSVVTISVARTTENAPPPPTSVKSPTNCKVNSGLPDSQTSNKRDFNYQANSQASSAPVARSVSARAKSVQPPDVNLQSPSLSQNTHESRSGAGEYAFFSQPTHVPFEYDPVWGSDMSSWPMSSEKEQNSTGSSSFGDAGVYEMGNSETEMDEEMSRQLKLQKRRMFQKNSKERLKQKRNTGEWYPGATTAIPTYDISQDHREVFLMSDGWTTCIKGIGQEFKGGASEFRIELIKYASKMGFHYNFKRNDPKYITALCELRNTDNCKWFVQGVVHSVTKSLFIKAANLTHTCRFRLVRRDTKRMGARVIVQIIQEQIREKPTLKPIELKLQLANTHGFHLEYMQVWRGVEHARASIFGCYQDSFDQLHWYSYSICKHMPGSITALEAEPVTNKFKRFFFAFKGSLEGFKFCRPMLFIDGTFMSNRYKGTILTATAKDGNNGLFPVVVAIVISENTENWVWFLTLVIEHVQHNQQIIYVSDRAGGILAAFDVISQKPYHFYCLWHLMKNLRDRYGNKAFTEKHRNIMCMLLKKLAYAPNERLFNEAMIPFINVGGEIARHFLQDLPKDRWAVAYAPDLLRYGELTSSAAESFNSRILEGRSLNINHLVDAIHSILSEWFVERAQLVDKHPSALTPAKEEAWNKNDNLSATWGIQMTTEDATKFHVLSVPSVVVDLQNKTCSCWGWKITGFPCCHVVAIITRGRLDIRDFVEPYFFTDTLRKVYSTPILAIPTTDKFEYPDQETEQRIEPPVIRQVPGRPQKKRFKKAKQPRDKRFKCDTCGQLGRHNWATCRQRMDDSQSQNPFDYNPVDQQQHPSFSCP